MKVRGGGGRGDGGTSRGSVLTLSASGLALLATTLQSSEKLTLLARNARQKTKIVLARFVVITIMSRMT